MNTSQEPMRILVADDDESLRSVLNQVLGMDGHEVALAASGEEALENFKRAPYPLVITDIRMGGMSGMELLKEVKRRSPDSEVIIMTSHAALDTAITAIHAGAYDYLTKPFEDIALISSVAQRAIEKIRLAAENKNLIGKLKRQYEELERANAALKDLSVRDGLTGLYNRRNFEEAIAAEIVRSRRYKRAFSVLFLDIDFFKQYNDKNGHPQGDNLLITLSRMLLDGLRSSDFVARYGGEEFIMILPETPKKCAWGVAEGIRRKIEEHPFDGRDVQPQGKVTVSIGVASYPDDGSDAATIIQCADRALYTAKEKGRNRVC